MKKIVLSLAGVLAATAFAPEAAAVPAFARQTGMACTACHAQHFPILNSFGRAFKAAGYTMMGAQGKVEGEHLSIPDTLNASIIMKVRYQDNDSTAPVTASNTRVQSRGEGQWQFFDEFALIFGGRVAENVGFMLEAQMIDNAAPFAAGFKMPFVFDMGGAKLSVTPFQTDALGVAYGYELSSGGVMRANRWAEHRFETSAVQYLATGGAATGVAFAAQNDMGYINLTKWAPVQMAVTGGVEMESNYVRLAATPTVGNWAMVVGLGKSSGTSYSGAGVLPLDTDQTFFDFQAQGEVGGKELGVYFQHAKAPATVNGNDYNPAGVVGNPDKKATTIGADYSVIPHVLSIGAAYRNADNGAAATVNGSDAWTVTAVYDLYQNVALHANYSSYSGSAHNLAAGVARTNATAKSLLTLMLEAAW